MKRFTTRILICAIPTLIAALIVAFAGYRYGQGQGGFKLGVDLVGGTILVYEADADRTGKDANFDPGEMAAQLKRRIDPSDLYNVTIRPVAGNRFEIILPTGGKNQADKEREAWAGLIEKVRANSAWQSYLAGTDLDVTLGNTKDLALRVSQIVNGQALKQKLLDKFPDLKTKPDIKLDELVTAPTARIVEALKGPTGAKEDELTKLIDDARATAKPEDVEAFVKANFAGGKRFVSAEKVQEIKDLISRQGSLEFRIVANKHRDGAAFKAAEDYFKDNKKAADEAARNGLPPAPPKAPEGAEPFEFSYSWVELAKKERLQLGLNNASKGGQNWNIVDAARQKGEPAILTQKAGGGRGGSSDGQYQYMIYSRKTDNIRLSAAEREQKQFDYFMLVRNPITPDKAITGRYLTSAQVSDLQLEPAVDFAFDSAGAALFADVTSSNLPQGQAPSKDYTALAILLDGEIVSAPSINSTISDRGQISGGFTGDEARKLATILKSGALPATLKPQPVSENTIGATLGDDTIRKGTFSIALAFIAVMAFMIAYYRFAGLVACIALMANLLFTIAFMVFVNATFTLPGLAGLVLTLGMAVDANVLIYERLREERERGMNLITALRQGYDRALPTIIDTHLTSIFTAIVLYAVGNDQLKGFGISLAAGLVISLFTSLYMTRLIFDIWQYKGWLTKLSMYQGLSNWIHGHYFDFMSVRKYWFAATATLTVLGLGLFLYRGPAGLNIDFVGGTAYGGRLAEPQDIGTLRVLLGPDNQAKRLAVEKVEQLDDKGFSFKVTYKDGTSQLVQFGHEATGATNAERERNVAERAAILPDWSVDQIFPSNEPSTGGRSRFFTVRTTEREPDMVQVAIDRLLRDESNKSMLETVRIKTIDVKDKSATLTFDKPASPGYLKLLLNRQFAVNKLSDVAPFELRGTGKGTDGRYEAMSLEVAGSGVPAEQLKAMLAEAQKSFEARPQPERLENFDAQLAAETSRRALYAILASWLAILLYLWFRFGTWQFGAAAVVCLIHDLCFTLGVIAVCHYIVTWVPGFAHIIGLEDFKIDLPAVAALLTLVGYSVNDTIVVLDRIREVRGKNPLLTEKMINDSVNQTLTRTLLASLTVWLVVFVLYIWGGEGVKLFAFVMVIGVFVGTYSSIYIAAPLLLIFGEGQPAKTPSRALEPAGAKA